MFLKKYLDECTQFKLQWLSADVTEREWSLVLPLKKAIYSTDGSVRHKMMMMFFLLEAFFLFDRLNLRQFQHNTFCTKNVKVLLVGFYSFSCLVCVNCRGDPAYWLCALILNTRYWLNTWQSKSHICYHFEQFTWLRLWTQGDTYFWSSFIDLLKIEVESGSGCAEFINHKV